MKDTLSLRKKCKLQAMENKMLDTLSEPEED
jgi:hypothetical protein